MWKWLHHLFNPHCELCELKELEARTQEDKYNACRTCQVYEMTNAQLVQDNQRLLDIILHGKEINQLERDNINAHEVNAPQPIQPPISWKERRRIMERESREVARVLNKQQEDLMNANKVEELEKALEVKVPEQVNA